MYVLKRQPNCKNRVRSLKADSDYYNETQIKHRWHNLLLKSDVVQSVVRFARLVSRTPSMATVVSWSKKLHLH